MNYVYFDEEGKILKWDDSIKLAWFSGGFKTEDEPRKAIIQMNVITSDGGRFEFEAEDVQVLIDKANKYFILTNDNPDNTKNEATKE